MMEPIWIKTGSDVMHEDLGVAGNALRIPGTINAQAEHWMSIVGMTGPRCSRNWTDREICQLLIRAELAGGLDIAMAVKKQHSSK